MKLKCGQCGHEWSAKAGLQVSLAHHEPERVRCTICRQYRKIERLEALLLSAHNRLMELRRGRRG